MGVFGLGAIETKGPQLVAWYWAFSTITGVFVALRLFGRTYYKGGWRMLWWDDYLLIIAQILSFIVSALTEVAVGLGYGRRSREIPLLNWEEIRFLGAIGTTASILTSSLSKTVVALMMWPLAQELRWMRISIIFVIASTNVMFTVGAIIPWVMCSPVEKAWKPTIEGSCMSLRSYIAWSVAVFTYAGAIDIFLAALPWFVIPRLNIQPKEKIAIVAAMSAGVVAGVATFIKAGLIDNLMATDPSWDSMKLNIAAITEVAITIIVACLPVIRVLLRDGNRWMKRQCSTRMAISSEMGPGGDGSTTNRITAPASTGTGAGAVGAKVLEASDVRVDTKAASEDSEGDIHVQALSRGGSKEDLVTEVCLVDYPRKKEEEV